MTDGGPWVLPMVMYGGVQYFADLRLRQFRNINNPHDAVDFDTHHGRQMCRHNGIVYCQQCHTAFIIPRIVQGRHLYCVLCTEPIR